MAGTVRQQRRLLISCGGVLAWCGVTLTLATSGAAAAPPPAAPPPAASSPAASSAAVPAATAPRPSPSIVTRTLSDGTIVILGPDGGTIGEIAPATSIVAPPSNRSPAAGDPTSTLPAGGRPDPLAQTGPATGAELALGAGLLGAGVVLTALGRRRRAH